MNTVKRHLVQQLADIAKQLSSIVDALNGPRPVVSPEIAERTAKLLAEGKCLLCKEIKQGRYTRGQCASCYQDTQRNIRQKKTTERSVIEAGFMTPEPSKGGRKRQGPSVTDETPDLARLAQSAAGLDVPKNPRKVPKKKPE